MQQKMQEAQGTTTRKVMDSYPTEAEYIISGQKA